MNTRHKTTALILSLVLVVAAFSGCGKSRPSGNPPPSDNASSDTEMAYVPESMGIPEEISYIIDLCVYEDQLYLAAALEPGTAGDTGAEISGNFAIYKMNSDGSDMTRLENYTPPAASDDGQSHMYLSAMCADREGNLWVAESNPMASAYFLRKLDAGGAELLRSDISYIAEGGKNIYINDMQADGSGSIYLSDFYSGVYVFNDKGIKSFEASSSGMVFCLVRLSGGTVAAYIPNVPESVLKTIDPIAKNWGADIPFEYSTGVFSGGGEYDWHYNDGSSLYGYSSAKRKGTEILNWLDCNMDGGGITSLEVLPDGRIICFTNSFDGEKPSPELTVLEMRSVERSGKTVLKLACFMLDDYIQGAVRKFNSENELYEIEVTDYSQYNTGEDRTAGYLKLDTEIISGNIPDIICANRRLPVSKYIALGMLEDLYPYLDTDTAAGGRDAFIPEVLKALETEGSLYRISPGFSIYTVIGSADVLGDKDSWSYDDIIGLLERYPEGTRLTPDTTASDALSFFSLGMDEYINWKTGECRFTDESFIKLLELAARFPVSAPAGDDYVSQLSEGRALFITNSINSILNLQTYRALFQSDISCTGFPTGSGSETRFMVTRGLSISSKSMHKDAAWEFISLAISEEYQKEGILSEFPTNKAAFDSIVEKNMTPATYINEEGEVVEAPIGYGSFDGFMMEIYAATKEDLDLVRKLIKGTEKLAELDLTVLSIIQEEALAYFNGQCSAADAASVIQSRVSTYISEQR